MISKSVLVKTDNLASLLNYLTRKFGYPVYEEELVIYVKNNLRISITRSGMVCRWHSPGRDKPDALRSKHRLTLDLRNLKDTLLFFAEHYGPKGVINTAPMLSFSDPSKKIWITVRPESLVGPLVKFLMPSNFTKQMRNVRYFRTLRRELAPFLEPGLRRTIRQIRQKPEPYLNLASGKSPMLAQPIVDFCRRNGIMHPLRWSSTHRQLLQERDNNYGKYELEFRRVTNVGLLTTSAHPIVRLPKTIYSSIIIPCWNVEGTILKTLASIRSQRVPQSVFDRLEVILMDDGSTIPVEQVVDTSSYRFRVKIVRLGSNHGVSHARELGLVHASGDILLFMDGDILLSKYYLADHLSRNSIIRDAVFVCFKENVKADDARIMDDRVACGLDTPDYSRDLRVNKRLTPDMIGTYRVKGTDEVRIAEETDYFKSFTVKNYGPYDLSSMVIGHNFSSSRTALRRAEPFHRIFWGYGMEDQYFGLRMISQGCYIIPVLSSGVYHIDHPPRSGSLAKQQAEKRRNNRLIDKFLDSLVE